MCTFGIFSISLVDKKRRGLSGFQVRHTHISIRKRTKLEKNCLVSKNPFDSSMYHHRFDPHARGKIPCWESEGLR